MGALAADRKLNQTSCSGNLLKDSNAHLNTQKTQKHGSILDKDESALRLGHRQKDEKIVGEAGGRTSPNEDKVDEKAEEDSSSFGTSESMRLQEMGDKTEREDEHLLKEMVSSSKSIFHA